MIAARGIALLLACLGCAAGGVGAPDPVTEDPRVLDREHPAAMAGLGVESGGERMNAIVYVAQGAGPHPVAILLHGLPGEERNLDLAQAIRRTGWNVLFFHYRGAWGSEGRFSFAGALADVEAAIARVRSADFADAYRADPERIALVGHSMGGFLALHVASEREQVDCVAAISPANLGLRAGLSAADAARLATRLEGLTAPLRGASGEALVAEIQQAGPRFDLVRRAPALADRPLLLVAGSRDRVTPVDTHHAPLVGALRAAGAVRLSERLLDADHAYSDHRIALARTVTEFLRSACTGS